PGAVGAVLACHCQDTAKTFPWVGGGTRQTPQAAAQGEKGHRCGGRFIAMNYSPRILLVDDDQAFLRLLVMRLTAAGYQTETAAGGEQALATMSTFQPALVITDLYMEGMNGMTMFERVNDSNHSLPLTVLTAHGTIQK